MSTNGPVLLSTTMSSLMTKMRNGPSTLSKPVFQLPGALTGEHPTRPHLHAVQEFFRYTEYQGATPVPESLGVSLARPKPNSISPPVSPPGLSPTTAAPTVSPRARLARRTPTAYSHGG